eukprot:10901186-Alexandrium_andersonii.AAC.1
MDRVSAHMARISRAICQPGGQGLGRDLANPVEIKLNPVYMDIELRGKPEAPEGDDPAEGCAYLSLMRQFVLLREAEERLHDEVIAVRALPLLIRRWEE